MNSKGKYWKCAIGPAPKNVPNGGDAPLRRAVGNAFAKMFGQEDEQLASGWGFSDCTIDDVIADPNQSSDHVLEQATTMTDDRGPVDLVWWCFECNTQQTDEAEHRTSQGNNHFPLYPLIDRREYDKAWLLGEVERIHAETAMLEKKLFPSDNEALTTLRGELAAVRVNNTEYTESLRINLKEVITERDSITRHCSTLQATHDKLRAGVEELQIYVADRYREAKSKAKREFSAGVLKRIAALLRDDGGS